MSFLIHPSHSSRARGPDHTPPLLTPFLQFRVTSRAKYGVLGVMAKGLCYLALLACPAPSALPQALTHPTPQPHRLTGCHRLPCRVSSTAATLQMQPLVHKDPDTPRMLLASTAPPLLGDVFLEPQQVTQVGAVLLSQTQPRQHRVAPRPRCGDSASRELLNLPAEETGVSGFLVPR